MQTLIAIGKWISSHTNKVGELGRQMMYAMMLFHVVHWTPEQQLAVLAVGSALLALFTESGTVSKQRVGERIDAEVSKITGTGTGTFKPPSGINGQ